MGVDRFEVVELLLANYIDASAKCSSSFNLHLVKFLLSVSYQRLSSLLNNANTNTVIWIY